MSDLVIRISGDVKAYADALEEAKAKTEDMSDTLKSVAAGSAIALAALAAESYAALSAFGEQEQASNKLTTSLQQQGIYSKALFDAYRKQADALQDLTGIDDDAIVGGQAMLQNMIGQTEITQELTASVLDLSVAKGMDLTNAFEVAGKAIEGNATALQKMGVEIELTTNREENMRRVTAALSSTFGGQSETVNQGVGSWRLLKAMFGEVQEGIGARLAPAFETIVGWLTKFFRAIKESDALLDFITSAGIAAAVVSAIGVAVGTAGTAFLALKAALVAANVSIGATSLAVKGLVGATGIGLLVLLISEIYLNWSAIWPRMQAVFAAFVNNTMNLFSSLGAILKGVFTLDTSLIKQGIADAKAALNQGLSDYNTTLNVKLAERQAIEDAAEAKKTAKNDKTAADREAKKRAHEEAMARIEDEKRQLLEMQANAASEQALNLQRQEIALLEQMEDEKNQKIRGALQDRLNIVREMQERQQQQDSAQREAFNNEYLAKNAEYQALDDQQKLAFQEQHQAQLQGSILTEKTAREQAAAESVKAQIEAQNTQLKNTQKYGQAYALIHRAMHSEVYQGTKTAFGEMAQMTQSQNAHLKAIGKAAAIANIIMKTAESAMAIYAGFSTIPIVGPPLGVAGAAAAIAFGAEQVGRVNAAADGGLLTGGIPGRDSIPVLAMPGELVVPTRNFDEVVNAVADKRSGNVGQGEGGGMVAHVVLQLKENLMDFIEIQSIERGRLGISMQGA